MRIVAAAVLAAFGFVAAILAGDMMAHGDHLTLRTMVIAVFLVFAAVATALENRT